MGFETVQCYIENRGRLAGTPAGSVDVLSPWIRSSFRSSSPAFLIGVPPRRLLPPTDLVRADSLDDASRGVALLHGVTGI